MLDKGSVELIGVLGDELTVVNAARASFGKHKTQLDDSDRKLIRYLLLSKPKHSSPFRHVIFQFRLKFPEFVGRQIYKHCIGIETTSTYPTKDHAWNEISRRYVKVNEFYVPDQWRIQSKNNKQASEIDSQGNLVYLNPVDSAECSAKYQFALEVIEETIEDLISRGVAREQAQTLLPIAFYTEVYWTASFLAIMNLLEQRNKPDAQWEIRQYAIAIEDLLMETLPVLTEEWLNHNG